MAKMARAPEAGTRVVRTTIRIPSDLQEAVEACARATNTSFNAIVNGALLDFVSSEERRARVDQFFAEGRARFQILLEKLSS